MFVQWFCTINPWREIITKSLRYIDRTVVHMRRCKSPFSFIVSLVTELSLAQARSERPLLLNLKRQTSSDCGYSRGCVLFLYY